VFAGCNLFAVFYVYFLLPETSGRSLEEIDTMFLLEIKPWKSSKWTPTKGEDLITADKLRLNSGARDIMKRREGGGGETEQEETVRSQGQDDIPQTPTISGAQHHLGAGARGNSMVGTQ
jgi:SP family sugar:H+ symporter-like MFS transporter